MQISQLWRYPVKSMVGGRVDSVELGDLRWEHGEVGEGFVVLPPEDAAQFGHDVFGVGRAPTVVLEIVGRSEPFEPNPMVECRAHAVVDVSIGRPHGRAVRQADLDVAAVDVACRQSHQ